MVSIRKVEKKEKGKTEIVFDNGLVCQLYRTELAELKALGAVMEENAEVNDLYYAYLLEKIIGKRAKKRAMFLLEQQDRSEQQLREKLEKSNYPKSCIDDAIAYVKGFHYLDDRRFACTFVRYSKEKMSRKQLEIKLMQKGIRRSDIAYALETEYPMDLSDQIESEQIRSLLQKRHYDPESADEKMKQRTYAFLLRRGFSNGKILKEMQAGGIC